MTSQAHVGAFRKLNDAWPLVLQNGAVAAISSAVGFRFFAVPAHKIVEPEARLGGPELLDPELPFIHEAVEWALSGAEFRGARARDRLRQLVMSDTQPTLPAPEDGFSNSAVFAQPPGDLPALLRLADQLETLARAEEGERALVWKCNSCGTRYAVPVALVRSVSIRCERCGNTVELKAATSSGEETLMDPQRGAINQARRALASFFREAMARGWPVLVSHAD